MTRAILAPTRYPGLKLAKAGMVTRIAPLQRPAVQTRFSFDVPDEYAYLAPLTESSGWVTVDEDGVIAVAPPADEPSGIIYLPVHVSHPSGDDLVFVNVQVVAATENGVNEKLPAISYGGAVRVRAGEARAVSPMLWDRETGEILASPPAGTYFLRGCGTMWVEVSSDGEVTARPTFLTPAGTHHIPVVMEEIATGETTTALVHLEVAGTPHTMAFIVAAGLLSAGVIVLLAQAGVLF